MAENGDMALDALGNAVRRDILRLLASGPRKVAEIAANFPISRPAVSRHLAQMVEADLLSYSSEGTSNFYRISPNGFESARGWLEALLRENAGSPGESAFEDLTANLLEG